MSQLESKELITRIEKIERFNARYCENDNMKIYRCEDKITLLENIVERLTKQVNRLEQTVQELERKNR